MMRPYAGRVTDPGGEHGHGVARGGVLPHQRAKRLRPEQGHIAHRSRPRCRAGRPGLPSPCGRHARCPPAAPARPRRRRAHSLAASALTSSRPCPTTTTRRRGSSSPAAASACPSMLRPHRACSTFGSRDFILVPSPAARTMTASGRGWLTRQVSSGSAPTSAFPGPSGAFSAGPVPFETFGSQARRRRCLPTPHPQDTGPLLRRPWPDGQRKSPLELRFQAYGQPAQGRPTGADRPFGQASWLEPGPLSFRLGGRRRLAVGLGACCRVSAPRGERPARSARCRLPPPPRPARRRATPARPPPACAGRSAARRWRRSR